MGPALRVPSGHWLAPLATVLNTCFHEPYVLAALAQGHAELICNQGMSFVDERVEEVDAEARALWHKRTGVALAGPLMFAGPAWLRAVSHVPREDVVQLLATMVGIHRQLRFPWLFAGWPCALTPAPGEEALLRALEDRAGRWDDELLRECAALGMVLGAALAAQRAALVMWGLPRLVALVDAAMARVALVGDRERWAEVVWSARSMQPPVSWRWFLDRVAPPEGLTTGAWLGRCEAVWLRVPDRSVAAGACGEWIVTMPERRVALAWAVELGTAMLTAWRPARDDEVDTSLLATVDRDRESAACFETYRQFVRADALRDTPSAEDLAFLAWLARAWDGVEAVPEAARDARRSLLLDAAAGAGMFAPSRREPLRNLLLTEGHHGLLALLDAGATLLGYLRSKARREVAGIGEYRQVVGAWVSPRWFLQRELREHPRPLELTARCEAALHGEDLGEGRTGELPATIDGAPRVLQWSRDFGLIPALSSLR